MRLTAAEALRLAWLAWGALALAAFVTVVQPAQGRLRALASQSHDLYDLANRNDRLRAAAGDLARAQRDVARDLRALAEQNTQGRATLAALRVLQRISVSQRVAVAELTHKAAAGTHGPDVGTVGLQGRYRDVVAAIAALSQGDALVEVDSADLRREQAGDDIAATVAVTIYRGTDGLTKGEPNAATAAIATP
ncbi:MAG TPA: hypothetical protein VMF61_08915 [Candidatus Acidoferrales bacterium]|nr:hypothetical protein [Candidatus Acidoferrales bacterium]